MDILQKKKIVSIITVTYNVSSLILPTLESIKKIKTDELEYIIVDGGSNDDTLSVFNKYERYIDKCISEKDNGIYDAMNKGIKLSSGEWIIFINCGDELYYIPIQLLRSISNDYVAVCGSIKDERGMIRSPKYNNSLYYGNQIPHQGLFYKKKYMPFFSLEYKVFADYDLNLKMYNEKKKMFLTNDLISLHSLDGISMNKKYISELYKVVYNNCGFKKCLMLFFHFRLDGIKKRILKVNK